MNFKLCKIFSLKKAPGTSACLSSEYSAVGSGQIEGANHSVTYFGARTEDREALDKLGIKVVNAKKHPFCVEIYSSALDTVHRLKVFVNGPENHLKIGGPGIIEGAVFFFGRKGFLSFGGNLPNKNSLRLTVRIFGDSNQVLWGKGSTSAGITIVCAGSRKRVQVGEDCMTANGSYIRNSDMHGVFCVKSLELIEDSMDVTIGNHVWLGQDCLVLKGVQIHTGSIVGAKSLVTKLVEPTTLVGGVPAKVIRRDVSWSRSFQPEEEDLMKVIDKWDLRGEGFEAQVDGGGRHD